MTIATDRGLKGLRLFPMVGQEVKSMISPVDGAGQVSEVTATSQAASASSAQQARAFSYYCERSAPGCIQKLHSHGEML